MNKTRKRILIAVAVLAVIFCGVMVGGAFYLYNYALNPTNQHDVFNSGKTEVSRDETSGDVTGQEKTRLEEESEPVYLTSYDGLKLHAYLQKNESSSHRYAVLVHGYKGNGASMGSFAEQFYSMGFHILAPDLRGHGYSEGDYIGMGWHDRLDVLDWVNYIIEKDKDAEILLFGISMGGATVMMVSGEPLPENIRLIIEDCGYSSVWDEFEVQLKDVFKLPSFPILNAASLLTELRAGYGFKEASAVQQVKKATVPMLFIHGDDDTFVPFWMLDVVYNAAASEKEKLVITGAGHGKASTVDPELYWSTVKQFVEKYMDVN